MPCACTATRPCSGRRLPSSAIAMLAWCWILVGCSAPEVTQPLSFNHKAHVEAKVDCLQCHEGVLDREAERLPQLETCAGCHKEPPGDDLGKQELARFIAAGTALVWQPALGVPDHVFFPHARHVDVAEMGCLECHADMSERTTPPRKVKTMGMDHCIRCHEEHPDNPHARAATLDCARCHR